MLSPPPFVKVTALLLFAVLQFCLFRPRNVNIRCTDRFSESISGQTLQADVKNGNTAIDPLLPHIPRPKIRQVSMHVYNARNATNDALDQRCMATHIEHGARWGYPTHILREDVRGKGQWTELLFSKPLYMLSIAVAEMAKSADERAEWLIFFDSDTILLNPTIPWTLFLPPRDFSDIHFLGTYDWEGFNAGVFLVRINEWSVKMLTEVAALPDLRQDVQVGYNAEQTAFKWVLKRAGYREHVLYQPNKWFNGFEQSFGKLPPVKDGDMLVHFSGLKEDKFGAVQTWLDRLEETPQELQVPLDKTMYPVNVDAYWSCMRNARYTLQQAEHISSSNNVTHEFHLAQADLQQTLYDDADKPAMLIEGIEKVKAALGAFETPEIDTVDFYSDKQA